MGLMMTNKKELKLMSIEELKKEFVRLASNLEDTTPVAQEMAVRSKKIMFEEMMPRKLNRKKLQAAAEQDYQKDQDKKSEIAQGAVKNVLNFYKKTSSGKINWDRKW